MQYIYAAMLLDAAGKPITEDGIKNVLAGAGVQADDAKVKALVSSLEGKNIKEIIASAGGFMPAGGSPPPAPAAKTEHPKPEAKKEEKKKEDAKKTEEDAAAGLGALFG